MNSTPRRGYTLIEAAAVLVLIGLMASSATLSLRGAYRGAEVKDIVGRIEAIDHAARSITEMTGKPGTIKVDQQAGKISFIPGEDPQSILLPVVLPNGYQITDVQVASSDTEELTTAINCSEHGRTPTYALTIAGPNEQSHFLVIAGMTGQLIEVDDDAGFDLDKLLTPRPDTH